MSGKAGLIPSKQINLILDLLGEVPVRAGCPSKYKTVFAIGIYTALRITEIVTLNYSDVFIGRTTVDQLVVRRLKKRKQKTYSSIPINPKLKSVLLAYKNEWDEDIKKKFEIARIGDPTNMIKESIKTLPLFPAVKRRGYLSADAVAGVFNGVFKQVNLDGCTTHSMRRTALTNLKNAGVSLDVIKEISGHSSLSQLAAYLHVTPDDVQAAIDKIKY